MLPLYLWSFGFLLLWTGNTLAFEYTSNGESGEKCGRHRCLDGIAKCEGIGMTCVCNNPPYGYGNGKVNCLRKNWLTAQVLNDPIVRNFNGDSIGLPLPCRYLLTHTVTDLKNRARDTVGYCDLKVHATHQKYKGKVYIAGYDIAIGVHYNNGSSKMVSVRKFGKGYKGDYTFLVNTTDNAYLPQGPWNDDIFNYHDPSTNLKLRCQFDDVNNLAIMWARKCGVRLQFRPYDCGYGKSQEQIPHLSYDINCAFRPRFLSKDKVVALPPKKEFGGKTIDDILLWKMNRQETLIVRALRSMAAQANPACTAAVDVLDTCTDQELKSAFHCCLFILESPRFMRCYDPTFTGVRIMNLFNKCVAIYCNGYSRAAVVGDIINSGCDKIRKPYPKLTKFVHNLGGC